MQKGMEAIQEGSLPSPIFSLHLMGGAIHQGVVRGAGKLPVPMAGKLHIRELPLRPHYARSLKSAGFSS